MARRRLKTGLQRLGRRGASPALNVITKLKPVEIVMNRLSQLLALASVAVALGLGANEAAAQERQGRGNFDPEQMRARMMERYKEALEVNSDAEWKIVESRIQKVMEARREVGFGGGGRGFFGRPGGGPGGDRGDRAGRGGDREVAPEADALQKAIDAKAPADEIKTKLAAYRESRQKKQAALETSRADLKKVLSVRQEATAVMMGLLE